MLNKINREDFMRAKEFIYSDIQREINLARVSENKCKKFLLRCLIENSGGANFMSALALLSYTEFAGKLKYNCLKANRDNSASENFNRFFDDLGDAYKQFRSNHNVYDIFRCGLAHEYFVKRDFTIYMLNGKESCGVGENNGKYFFVVECYFNDFQKAFNDLENILFQN